jgi:hypothetical protein
MNVGQPASGNQGTDVHTAAWDETSRRWFAACRPGRIRLAGVKEAPTGQVTCLQCRGIIRIGAAQLHQGPELAWKALYADLARALIDGRASTDRKAIGDAALALLDELIAKLNRRLPEGCWWAPGSAAIYGPPGTELPDIAQLVATAYAEVAPAQTTGQGNDQ